MADDNTPREPVAARAVLRMADLVMLRRHARPSVASERGCVYCGGDSLAAQVSRIRWIGFGILVAVIVDGGLLIATLLR
jgi:hypothetical protein